MKAYFCGMAKASGPSFPDIMKSLRKGDYAPLYFLHGEEDYFIDTLADYIEANALPEDQRAFNQSVVYGRDVTAGQIRDMAGRLPMMAPRQVIIVREAQDVRDLSALEAYVTRPVPTTLLVLCHKHRKLDGRGTLHKKLQEPSTVYFESKKLYDEKIPDWIRGWLKDEGYDITPEALALAHEYLGNQLSTITGQLQKVMIGLEKGSTIEVEVIRRGVGISRDYNVFELQKALGQRQIERVYHILDQMIRDLGSNPPAMVIPSLGQYFIRIYTLHQMHGAKEDEMARAIGIPPFLLRDYRPVMRLFQPSQLEHILGLLHEADLKSKGLGMRSTGGGELLRELIHRILAA
jgi:DNA polymerase III subunit delta